MKIKRAFTKRILFRALFALGGVGVCMLSLIGVSLADTPTALSLSSIQTNLGGSVVQLATMLSDVCLVAGVGFTMASFFKFHQHKLNPTQVPISQGLTLILIGAGLLLFPIMLPTATKAAFGETQIAKVSGSQIQSLVGSPGGSSNG